MKVGDKVILVDDSVLALPGEVINELRKHRGPSQFVVKWPGGGEDAYEKGNLVRVR